MKNSYKQSKFALCTHNAIMWIGLVQKSQPIACRIYWHLGTFEIVLFLKHSRVPVIVEKSPKARIGDLDKKKYLVPSGRVNS